MKVVRADGGAPIYHQVCDDLGVYPQAMKRRTHESFMKEHGQDRWLRMQLTADKVNTNREGK